MFRDAWNLFSFSPLISSSLLKSVIWQFIESSVILVFIKPEYSIPANMFIFEYSLSESFKKEPDILSIWSENFIPSKKAASDLMSQLLIAMDSQKEEEKMLQDSLESSGKQDGSPQVVLPYHKSQCAMAWASMPMMSLKCDMRSLSVLPQQALVCCHDESQYAMVSKPVCHDES